MNYKGDYVMNQEEFIREAWDMRNSMLRLACSILKEQHEAEDAVQDAIVMAWRKLDTLKSDQAFKTWMMRIVINTCRSMQRKSKRYVLKPSRTTTQSSPQITATICSCRQKTRE